MDDWLVVAVGSLATPRAGWVGFVRRADGYHLACGAETGAVRVSPSEGGARTDELLLLAMAYFEEAVASPPAQLEATQADLGGLLRWLAGNEADGPRRVMLAQALDAVDDGLAGDAVVGRLAEARAGAAGNTDPTSEQADLVDLLAARCASLGGAG